MLFSIYHLTQYTYSEDVFLEPHYLHFYPVDRPHLELVDFSLNINPATSGQALIFDAFNNKTHQIWFDDLTKSLLLEVNMRVQTKAFNPFEYLEHPEADLMTGNIYNEPLEEALQVFLNYDPRYINEEIRSYLNEMKSTPGATGFMSSLLDHVYNNWNHEVRNHPDVWTPDFCFAQKKGSCRDLAWMVINMMRSVGLAARFVSGYAYNNEETGHELHAWVEVFVPGGGWVGIDPSLGLFVDHTFVPTAIGAKPRDTMPVLGNYRGRAQAQLDTQVVIVKKSD